MMSQLPRHLSIRAKEIDCVACQHESGLSAESEVFGKNALGGIAKHRFFGPVPHLEIDGNRFCRVVELMVEERQPCFKRMGHFLTVAEKTQDIERHAGNSGLL